MLNNGFTYENVRSLKDIYTYKNAKILKTGVNHNGLYFTVELERFNGKVFSNKNLMFGGLAIFISEDLMSIAFALISEKDETKYQKR